MSELKTRTLDCYLAGVRTEGVGRTISSAERGLRDSRRRADELMPGADPATSAQRLAYDKAKRP